MTTRSIMRGQHALDLVRGPLARSSWQGPGAAAADGLRDEVNDAADAAASEEDDVEGHESGSVIADIMTARDRVAGPGRVTDGDGDGDGPELASPVGGVDELTGLLDACVVHAPRRGRGRCGSQRYHRPATIVIFELDGLERLDRPAGAGRGRPRRPRAGRHDPRLARGADHVARLAPGRFGVLLPETDEIAAINYVERVRRACDLWLESGAIALRLAIGWAGTTGDPSLLDGACGRAPDACDAELRRLRPTARARHPATPSR